MSIRISDKIQLDDNAGFASRAELKLVPAVKKFNIVFGDKCVLDIGSSTGGFTNFALKQGASKVIAVDIGTDQMRPEISANTRVELHEKTDFCSLESFSHSPDIVMIDVSFISIRKILLHALELDQLKKSQFIAMVKPQFEAQQKQKHKGVVKNSTIRRSILRDFELWASQYYNITAKADSQVAGAKGNLERFYLLRRKR